MNIQRRNPWRLILPIGFFFGFPVLGLLFFWGLMHRTIEQNAVDPAREIAGRVLAEGGPGYRAAAAALAPYLPDIDRDAEAFIRSHAELGGQGSLVELRPTGSKAREVKDQMWQFAILEGMADYAGTRRPFRMEIGRVYLEPNWALRRFELQPGGDR
ncbi:MAG: hypothetical protein MH204_00955 [Fimbriimonadaceae bacterium]|nr:hypothetical protein [Fimbriimonadaceae bacterium]